MSDFIEFPEHILNSPQLSYEEKDAAAQAKVQKIVGKAIWTEEDEKKFIQRINNDPKVLEFFKPYSEYNVQSFKEDYLRNRKQVINLESMTLNSEFRYPKTGDESAQKYFWHIQQRKLFDKQCLWRAKKIDIPQIKSYNDFLYWAEAIKYCPFIEPVQPDEVELLKAFLLEKGQDPDMEAYSYSILQDYQSIKDNEYYPPFYAYWDLHKGVSNLAVLPDVRGTIEDEYRRFWFERKDKESVRLNAEYANRVHKPYMDSYDEETMEKFIDITKDTHFKKIYHKHLKEEAIIYETEDYDLSELGHQCRLMPMNYPLVTIYPSWRKNVAATISKYHHEVYANNMDRIYEMYCMEREMELELDMDGDDARHIKSYQNISEIIRTQILSGRKLAGEPEDWSFLQD